MTCGLKTLEILNDADYSELEKKCEKLMTGFAEVATELSIDFTYDFEGGMFGFAFAKDKPQRILMMRKLQMSIYSKHFSLEC